MPGDAISGDAYEVYVGRWSRLVAGELVRSLAVPPGGTWLDVGCGTGTVARAVLENAAPRRVIGVDLAEDTLAYARAHIIDERIEFRSGDARALPLPDASVDAVVSGLVINFVPDMHCALREMIRVARPGAVIAAYVWDFAGEMQMLRRFWDAAVALDPEARSLDHGTRYPVCAPEPLRKLMADCGASGVEVLTIDVPTVFKDFDDYWSPFMRGHGAAPEYCASLGEERRAALRERLRSSLPTEVDGRVRMIARAFAVHGTKPA